MNEVVVEELSAKAMIEEVIAEVQSEFSKKPAEERAFILIKGLNLPCDIFRYNAAQFFQTRILYRFGASEAPE